MSYVKIFFPILLTSIFIFSCKKKNQNPEEYFSFYANGVKYEYLQEKGHSLAVGAWKTLGAGPTFSSLGYILRARSRENPTAEGAFYFNFPGNEIPSQDTIILDGLQGFVMISDFQNGGNNFQTNKTYNGQIIFTEKNSKILKGTFEFKAQQQYDSSILHITNGKFSIIPSPSL